MTMPDSQRYPWNINLINNVEDIVDFLGVKVSKSGNSSMFPAVEMRIAQVTFVKKNTIENNLFYKLLAEGPVEKKI